MNAWTIVANKKRGEKEKVPVRHLCLEKKGKCFLCQCITFLTFRQSWRMAHEIKNKRGLASASAETRKQVAKMGGKAPHQSRGLQAASPETRREVARRGGRARGAQRRKASEEMEQA